jgi:hypothetical protein
MAFKIRFRFDEQKKIFKTKGNLFMLAEMLRDMYAESGLSGGTFEKGSNGGGGEFVSMDDLEKLAQKPTSAKPMPKLMELELILRTGLNPSEKDGVKIRSWLVFPRDFKKIDLANNFTVKLYYNIRKDKMPVVDVDVTDWLNKNLVGNFNRLMGMMADVQERHEAALAKKVADGLAADAAAAAEEAAFALAQAPAPAPAPAPASATVSVATSSPAMFGSASSGAPAATPAPAGEPAPAEETEFSGCRIV